MPMYDPFSVMGAPISNSDITRYAESYNSGLVRSPEEFNALHPFVRAHVNEANIYVLGMNRSTNAPGVAWDESRYPLKSRADVLALDSFLKGGAVPSSPAVAPNHVLASLPDGTYRIPCATASGATTSFDIEKRQGVIALVFRAYPVRYTTPINADGTFRYAFQNAPVPAWTDDGKGCVSFDGAVLTVSVEQEIKFVQIGGAEAHSYSGTLAVTPSR